MSRIGNVVFRNTLIALAILVTAAPALEAANCRTMYRLWQNGQNTYYQYGETIVLAVGESGDLYVHAYPSGGEHPYSASADIGASSAFKVGGHDIRDVRRYLQLGDHDPQKGKISLTGKAAGNTALGYEIRGVAAPGQLQKVPRECRVGRIRISVRQAARQAPPPPAAVGSANDAAHQLITQLYTGILRRSPAEARDYPDGFFDQVQRDGFSGLYSIAQTMTSSSEFRSQALQRTSQAMERSGVSTRGLSRQVMESQLLTDMWGSLYGRGSLPSGDAQRRMAGYLSDCISGRAGNEACRRLGQDLVSQTQYQRHNRDLLQYLR